MAGGNLGRHWLIVPELMEFRVGLSLFDETTNLLGAVRFHPEERSLEVTISRIRVHAMFRVFGAVKLRRKGDFWFCEIVLVIGLKLGF